MCEIMISAFTTVLIFDFFYELFPKIILACVLDLANFVASRVRGSFFRDTVHAMYWNGN